MIELLDYSLSIRHTRIQLWQNLKMAAAFSRQSNYATKKKRFGLRFPKVPQGVHKSFVASIAITV